MNSPNAEGNAPSNCGRFIALAALSVGKVGMHSICKWATAFAKWMGVSQDDAVVPGRWK